MTQTETPTPQVIADALVDLEPGTADFDFYRALFQRYLVQIGARADDTPASYRRKFPPVIWMPSGLPDGHFMIWSRAQGTRFFLHRTNGALPPWPSDAETWLELAA